MSEEQAPTVAADRLERFVADALRHYDVPEEDANIVAGLMVEADLLGHETHGVFRLRSIWPASGMAGAIRRRAWPWSPSARLRR